MSPPPPLPAAAAGAQLVFSPRERAPSVVPVARQLARTLQDAGREVDAGWLLLALVASELVRTEPLAAPSRTLARDAAELLATGGEVLGAAEVRLALGEQAFALSLLQGRGLDELIAKVKAHEDPPQLLVQAGLDGTLRVASVPFVRSRAAKALEGTVNVSNAEKVLPLAELLGLHAHVARMAAAVGQHERAAAAWLAAGEKIAAARAFHQLGDPARALDALVLVDPQHPEFRKACVFAVRLAWKLDRLDYDLYHMMGGFMDSQPLNAAEAEALALLAELFERHGQPGPCEELRALAKGETGRHGVETLPVPDLSLPPLPPEPAPAPTPLPHEATLERRRLAPRAEAAPPPASVPGMREAMEEPAERPDNDMVGLVVGGRYCIDALLGRGGHGIVYKATDLALNEQVALKFLKGLGHDREAIKRFRRELKLARRLTHPNIVRVHDLGEDRGTLFLSMELLHGLVLRRLPRSALPLHRAIDVICQAADGLSAAHEVGVVHRDVKPDNLFVTQDGTIKVMDFGLARASEVHSDTQTGLIAGTPTYMSPEQVESFSSVTAASDQYSLAVVAFILLAGRPPFTHREIIPLLRLHAEAPPPRASSFEPGLRHAVDPVLQRALAKSPHDRFPSCRDFATALAEAAGVPRPQPVYGEHEE